MDTRDLTAFKTVYELGSIARAAKTLYISPQGLSKTVARLEAELGYGLFTRTTHGVEPTDAARVLYPRAGEISGLLDAVARDMARSAQKASVRVAASSGYFTRFGSAFVRQFERDNPGCTLEVGELTDADVLGEVVDGRADCGYSSAAADPALLDAVPLARHRFVLMVDAGHRLAAREAVDYADLEGLVVTAMGRGHSPYGTIGARLREHGVRPAAFMPILEISTGIDLARRGEAACVLTDFAASAFSLGDVAVVPFRDPSFVWVLSFVTRKGTALAGPVESLRDFSASWLSRHREVVF